MSMPAAGPTRWLITVAVAVTTAIGAGCSSGPSAAGGSAEDSVSVPTNPRPSNPEPSNPRPTSPEPTDSATSSRAATLAPTATGPAFESSVRSSDVDTIDYITDADPSAFACREFLGMQTEEMLVPGSRSGDDEVAMVDSYVYQMHFTDGTTMKLVIAPEVGDEAAADKMAAHFEGPFGTLPTMMRSAYGEVKLYGYDRGPSSEPGGGWFSMGLPQVQERLDDNDLHETVFHESVHMALDADITADPDWIAAQEADGQFLTEYAEQNPDREDVAETALFAYTYAFHRDRLGEAASVVSAVVPNRLAYLTAEVFGPDEPLTYEVAPARDCSANG